MQTCLKKCAPPTTSGPEPKQPNSPCNTVIHWGIYYYHCILEKWFKNGGGKGHHIKCWFPVYSGDNLDFKFLVGGKIITSKFYLLQKKKILQKLGLKIHSDHSVYWNTKTSFSNIASFTEL